MATDAMSLVCRMPDRLSYVVRYTQRLKVIRIYTGTGVALMVNLISGRNGAYRNLVRESVGGNMIATFSTVDDGEFSISTSIAISLPKPAFRFR